MAFSSIITLTKYPNFFSSSFSSFRQIRRFLTPTSFKSMAAASSASIQETITAPYGSWKSPLTADIISGADKRLGGTAVDGNGNLFWLESRPTESGRLVIVKAPEKIGDEPVDITPKDFSVRTVCQEYGGGAFNISGDKIIFSNYKDQRLYQQSIKSNADAFPVPITPDYGEPSLVNYADGVFDLRFNRYITVREDGRKDRLNSTTTIVTINLQEKNISEPEVLISGNDFYASPRLDAKGERLAWIEWGHPNMPWDKSELWVGYISDKGDVYERVCVAGGDPAIIESPTEPKWSSKGELFFISDRENGFWNIYKWDQLLNKVVPVYSMDAEFTKPLWVFGISSYQILRCNEQHTLIACSYRKNGRSFVGILDDTKNTLTPLDIPFTDTNNIALGVNELYVEGGSAILPLSIAKVTLDAQLSIPTEVSIVWSSSPDSIKYESYFSLPELIEFPTEVPGQNAYAFFYPPNNPHYQASGEKPPLLVRSHGGPTAETRGILNLSYQYWTSRGWAIADVNYGGSTGYGREYRERLLGQWGVVDVNDCCSCAKFLVDSGKVDGERLCIAGGSAGGYTTLAALAFKDTFKAGASMYGIPDLQLMREETHKFESCYIDNLVGNKENYFKRAPINFVDQFSCPIILLQGLEDKVVPPNQAQIIYHALKKRGLPVALIEYEGEGHGFRNAKNIKSALEQQFVFFARTVGGFSVADDITPVKVDNLD
ncbi:uncharacterized protein LOC124926309 [Impatiens glandulifera]|uniref:uncharacterized protein LOC124926309 n=1 Tax=Impatiens glandulifera TaxID=253017 RepID=UPI001FB17265|nr:uncharacterized protein LOC124926309 [Impatiens glandulifera]